MPLERRKIIVAIDGLSATGKSTLARTIAKRVNYKYIDTGAMYRAVVLQCTRDAVCPDDLGDPRFAEQFFSRLELVLDRNSVYLGKEDVSKEIRTQYISTQVSTFAQLESVRSFLLKKQRSMGVKKGVIMDGRDIGTVVFPEAEIKIYLTADTLTRAQRRFDEIKDTKFSLDEIRKTLEERDGRDMNRKIAPLVKAPDAIPIDNSTMTIDQQVDKICLMIDEKTFIPLGK